MSFDVAKVQLFAHTMKLLRIKKRLFSIFLICINILKHNASILNGYTLTHSTAGECPAEKGLLTFKTHENKCERMNEPDTEQAYSCFDKQEKHIASSPLAVIIMHFLSPNRATNTYVQPCADMRIHEGKQRLSIQFTNQEIVLQNRRGRKREIKRYHMKNVFVTHSNTKGYKEACKRACFTMQKSMFYTIKGHLLHRKRASFTMQKGVD